jgi:cell division protein FtsW (lipid II flippase)
MLSMAIAIGLVLSISRKVNFEYEEKVKKINEKR